MLESKSFILLIIILQFAVLGIVVYQQFIVNHFAYSSTNSTQPMRLTGPINSLQFSSDGNVSWIVSGRWRMDANFDSPGIVPVAVRSFNATLVIVPEDGTKSERFYLSDFKQDLISYDNQTKTSTINGKLTMDYEEPIENVGVILSLVNKNILAISLDQSKIREQFGETPFYGIER